MEISNKSKTQKVKRLFNYTSLVIVAVALTFLWNGKDLIAMYIGFGFVVYLIALQFVDMNYIFFSSDHNKIVVRYYQVISFLKKDYNAIEFPQHLLFDYKLEKTIKFYDLTLTIKTKRGVADYPPVSLVGLNSEQIGLIDAELRQILRKNKNNLN
jgi:hypothetical protein